MLTLKRKILALLILLGSFQSWAQINKPTIDAGMLGTWPSLINDIKISANGSYVAYSISNQPVGRNSLVLQAVKADLKRESLTSYTGWGNIFYFSADSRHVLWQSGDSLFLKAVAHGQKKLLAIIDGACQMPGEMKGEWMTWREKNKPEDLVLYNLVSGQKQIHTKARDAVFDEKGNVLLVLQGNDKRSLRWVTLSKKVTEKVIWEGTAADTASSFRFDNSMQQLCFVVNKPKEASVHYYRIGMISAIGKYNSATLPKGWQMSGLQGFNSTGRYLLVNLTAQKEMGKAPDPTKVGVDVWSYRDRVIHPSQIAHSSARYSYDKKGLLSIPIKKDWAQANLLNSDGLTASIYDDYCLLTNDTIPPPISIPERWILPSPQMWLQSLRNGVRKELPYGNGYQGISPDGCFLLFWVCKKGKRSDYYSYEIATGKTSNLTGKLPVSIAEEKLPYLDSTAVGIAGWCGKSAMIVYDNYDIWKLDLSGKKAPINITGGYGIRNHIKLRLVAGGYSGNDIVTLNGTEELLLTGYNEDTKYNGFFKLQLGVTGSHKPQMLSMQPFSWFKTANQVGKSAQGRNQGIMPLSGSLDKEKVWVLMGESATEYPNYYYTPDFKQFIPLTDLRPQKSYNWLTTEMVNWPLPDGQTGQGVLYKPENFDPSKKYPMIFSYYERKSGWMYQFKNPGLSYGEINIPWFVSRGYLVFIPDIPVSDGSITGISSSEHAWLAVESAAKYLSKRSYLDSSRLGLQGASFGAQMTLGIYTRSKRFAAAVEEAGFTDEMSSYLGLIYFGGDGIQELTPMQAEREKGHNVLGATPWEKPELYLKNSAVWRADRIGGPLLIVHNKKDLQVPWRQGMEMYMALRRLGKPCWMLQYDKGGHSVTGKAAEDYTKRMEQYFDHYLKHKPAPRWMTQGIPARFKQVEDRFELDPEGSCSPDCKICKEKKYDKND